MVRWIQWFINTYLNLVNSPHIMWIELAPASASCRVGENNLWETKPSEAQYVSRNNLGQNNFIF